MKNGDWIILFSKRALKDKSLFKEAGLDDKAKTILSLIKKDPVVVPPSYKKLVGKLDGFYSRSINIQHRLIFRVDEEKHTIYILSCGLITISN